MRHVLTIAAVATLPVLSPVAAWAEAPDDAALMEEAQALFEPIPDQVPDVRGNAVTREKIDLGRMLFFDPRLSASHLLSCNTCHNLAMGGDDNLETSIGHGWQAGPRNSPTVYNAVFNIAQFWDGRAADLKEQAKGPIQAGVEMNNQPAMVVETLSSMPAYVEYFTAAFPGDDDPVTFDNVARAIEAFEATLITPAAPFDQFLEGNADALTEQEKRGLRTFIDTGCVACHAGVNLGGEAYYPFGVVERPGADILPPEDKGRFAVTDTATDEYVFRSPTLRNVALTKPYFHAGRVWDLTQAVAVMGVAQLGEDLNEDQVDDIVAFLHTLTGEAPEVIVPVLPASSVDTPRPAPMDE
ncbi:cytochrome-c peroxidase [Roseospira visakhapatnamensis]|uniref:Cytochrome c peroxidase n=1 Tax=Roseospira visakhapatnamensis TaxID=390880 RepID=A0A7W6W8Y4_9PROT|nr:cytochrome-c peroxidase [Roseospira visakhapatnamensis]MBB4265520.1 cytochrome c peroxidase [Roseospira visakhapatnamensis]